MKLQSVKWVSAFAYNLYNWQEIGSKDIRDKENHKYLIFLVQCIKSDPVKHYTSICK